MSQHQGAMNPNQNKIHADVILDLFLGPLVPRSPMKDPKESRRLARRHRFVIADSTFVESESTDRRDMVSNTEVSMLHECEGVGVGVLRLGLRSMSYRPSDRLICDCDAWVWAAIDDGYPCLSPKGSEYLSVCTPRSSSMPSSRSTSDSETCTEGAVIKLDERTESSYMTDTFGLGLPMTVGSEGAARLDLRGTPSDPAKLGRRSRGGIEGAVSEVVVQNVLVDV